MREQRSKASLVKHTVALPSSVYKGRHELMAFKSDKNPKVSNDGESASLLLAAAGAVSPVSELNAVNRAALCRTATVVHVQRNDIVKPEGAHRWLMYLVEGTLTLHNGKDEVGSIAARSNDALTPLFQDKGAYQSARTNTVAKLVKFGREQLDILLREQQKNAIHVVDVEVGQLENLVFDDIVADMAANKVRLGSSKEAASRVLAALPTVTSIPELAEVIQSDVGLATHVVRAANKVDAGSSEATTSIRGAISRLGVEATQRCIEETLLANTLIPANDVIEKRLKRFEQRSKLSSALAQVLTKDVPDCKAEVAALVALVADVGELMVLTYANDHADHFKTEADLATVGEKLRTVLGSWLTAAWDFSPHFVAASSHSRDWYRNHLGEITYADLVTGALLIIQSEVPDTVDSSIPSADNLLLARRLQQAGINLTSPGDILKAATSHIVSVQAMLKTG